MFRRRQRKAELPCVMTDNLNKQTNRKVAHKIYTKVTEEYESVAFVEFTDARAQPCYLFVKKPQSILDARVLQGNGMSLLGEEKSEDEVEDCVKTASNQLGDEGQTQKNDSDQQLTLATDWLRPLQGVVKLKVTV